MSVLITQFQDRKRVVNWSTLAKETGKMFRILLRQTKQKPFVNNKYIPISLFALTLWNQDGSFEKTMRSKQSKKSWNIKLEEKVGLIVHTFESVQVLNKPLFIHPAKLGSTKSTKAHINCWCNYVRIILIFFWWSDQVNQFIWSRWPT